MTNDIYVANGYQQNNNHGKWRVILILLFSFILLLLYRCSPEKKLAKARQMVLTDSLSYDIVGRNFLEKNPCVNIITHTSDTITLTAHDTTQTFYHYTDSINRVDTIRQNIKTTVIKTVIDTVIDGQQIKLLQQQLTQRDLQIAGMNGQILAAHNATLDVENTLSKYKWGIGIFIFIVLGFTAFKIFAKNNPATATATASSNVLTSITNLFKKK